MSLLSIIQDAVVGSGTIPPPTSIISNSDPAVKKLLRLSNKVGLRLMKVFAWQILRGEQTFTSVATETQTAILPSDFDRIIKETFWDRTTPVMITGPVSVTEWQGLKATSYSNTQYPKFAYRGDNILVIPTPSAGKTLAFEYVKKNWCQSSGGTGQTAWAADTDTGILDEELMTLGVEWEYLTSEGLPSNTAAEAFAAYFKWLTKNENPVPGILVAGDIFGSGRHYNGVPGGTSSVINWG